MTEFGIISFHGIGVSLAFGNFVPAQVIPEPLVGIKPVAVVPLGLGRLVNHLLNGFLGADPNHSPA